MSYEGWPMNDGGCLAGHYWYGSSQCSLCGARLRCECGQYMREDNIESHIDRCLVVAKLAAEEAGPDGR